MERAQFSVVSSLGSQLQWGHQWSAKRVEFCSDNTAVVEVLRSGTSRDSNLMVLLRHLSLLATRHSFVSRSWKIKCYSWRHFSFWISAVPSASSLCVSHCITNNSFGPGSAACSLDRKCKFYLSKFLSLQILSLLQPDGCIVQRSVSSSISVPWMVVSSNGSLLPTNEQTLLRFCSHLADRFDHSSIKVYLSAIRSLDIDQGFPDPLVNCLQLHRLLRGV